MARKKKSSGLKMLDAAADLISLAAKAQDDDDDEDNEPDDDEDDEDKAKDKKKNLADPQRQQFGISQEGLNERGLGHCLKLDVAGGFITYFDDVYDSSATRIPSFDSKDEAQKFFLDLGFDSAELSKGDSDVGNFFERVVDSVRDDNGDFRPAESDMPLIQKWAKKKKLKANQVKVYNTYSADKLVDRKYTHFTSQALKDMADLSPGNPVMEDHAWGVSQMVFGKIFEAKVAMSKASGQYLFQRFYIPDLPQYQQYIDGIEYGINDKLSVGVKIPLDSFMCDNCKKSWIEGCRHYPGDTFEDPATREKKTATFSIGRVAAFLELSRVGVPAQPLAHVKGTRNISKSAVESSKSTTVESTVAKIPSDSDMGKSKMDVEQILAKLSEIVKSAPESAEATAKSVSEAVAKQLGETKLSEDMSKQIEAAAVAGIVGPLTALAKALDEREAATKTALEENCNAIKSLIDLHQKMAEKLELGMTKSVDDIKRFLASDEAKKSGAPEVKETTKEDETGFFSSFVGQLVAGAKKQK